MYVTKITQALLTAKSGMSQKIPRMRVFLSFAMSFKTLLYYFEPENKNMPKVEYAKNCQPEN